MPRSNAIAALVLAAALSTSSAVAQQPVPPSAFGIVAHTPIDELDVIDHDPKSGVYGVHAPVPLEGPFGYGVRLSPDGRVCDVLAMTPPLPQTEAGPLRSLLYLRLSSRHGPTWKSVRSPPFDVWAPTDGSAARIVLTLTREPQERETVFLLYSFLGPDGQICYPGQT